MDLLQGDRQKTLKGQKCQMILY